MVSASDPPVSRLYYPRGWRRPREGIGVSITGVAGPSDGSDGKPVGFVVIGVARRGGSCRTERHFYPGDRAAVRDAALRTALELLGAAANWY
jgi:nicotinamide-nucleotide amidase